MPNTFVGGAICNMEVKYKIDTSKLQKNGMDAVSSITTPLALDGVETKSDIIRMVQPGEKFGYSIESISGAGAGASTACAVSIIWYQEPVN